MAPITAMQPRAGCVRAGVRAAADSRAGSAGGPAVRTAPAIPMAPGAGAGAGIGVGLGLRGGAVAVPRLAAATRAQPPPRHGASRRPGHRVRTRAGFQTLESDDGEAWLSTDDSEVKPLNVRTPYDSEIFRNVLSCTGAAVADPLMSLVDTYFVAFLGTVPLAAVGANTAVFNAIFHFGTFATCHSVTNHIAHALAKHDKERSGRDLITAITLTLTLGVIIAGYLCSHPLEILQAVGVDPSLYKDGVAYMVCRGAAIPATLFMLMSQGVFRAILDMRTPFLVVLAAGFVNLVLDPLFIFGFGWGVFGGAFATAIAQYCGALGFAVLIYKRRKVLGLSHATVAMKAAGKTHILKVAEVLEFLVTMLTLGLRSANIIIVWAVAGSYVARLGVAETAGHQIVLQLVMLLINFSFAFMTVGQSMVAARGEPYQLCFNMAQRIIVLCMGVCSFLATSTALGWTAVIGSLTSDPAVMGVALPCLPMVVTMLVCSCNNSMEGVLVGSNDIKFVTLGYIPATIFYFAALNTSYKLGLGLKGVWLALNVYYGSLLVLFGARVLARFLKGPFFYAPPAPMVPAT